MYAFNALDLDTEWSSLPSCKKRTRESGKSRLPIKIPGHGGGSGKVEEAGMKRRVITYLPPPKVIEISWVVVEDPGLNKPKHEETLEDATTLSEKNIRSPQEHY